MISSEITTTVILRQRRLSIEWVDKGRSRASIYSYYKGEHHEHHFMDVRKIIIDDNVQSHMFHSTAAFVALIATMKRIVF